jgi:hypothetical protein
MSRTKVRIFESYSDNILNTMINQWLESSPNAVIIKADTVTGRNQNDNLCIVTTITYTE